MRRSLTSIVPAALIAVLIAALAGPLTSTASADSVVCNSLPGGVRQCSILEPNVRRAQTQYSQIQFVRGDFVTVTAGGCVQTGGKGKTWKHYVTPISNSGLYHGRITIPGLFLQRNLQDVVGGTVRVTQDGSLVLGYQDNNYGDNGYYDRNDDDGTFNQCFGLANAFVSLTISHPA